MQTYVKWIIFCKQEKSNIYFWHTVIRKKMLNSPIHEIIILGQSMIYVQVLLENVYNVHIHMNNMTYFFNGILSSLNPSIYSLTHI